MRKVLIFISILIVSLLIACGSKDILPEDEALPIVENSQEEKKIEEAKEEEKEEEIDETKEQEEIEKPEKIEEDNKEEEDNNKEENKDTVNNKDDKDNKEKTTVSGLSNDLKAWWFKRNNDNLPPGAQSEINLSKYDAYYLGNTNEKKIYLTFDEGYEYGYTSKILDILKENNVQAAFFVTKSYIKSQPELVKRMVEEGHIVGNHTVTHPSLPSKSNEEVEFEIIETARYFEELTGKAMDPFFRPPAGEYSERTLQITKDLGYKTIFWSMAYKDWDVNNQPGKEAAYNHVVSNHHPGAIILFHAVSSSNTEALDDIIKYLKGQGYEFASLYQIN